VIIKIQSDGVYEERTAAYNFWLKFEEIQKLPRVVADGVGGKSGYFHEFPQ